MIGLQIGGYIVLGMLTAVLSLPVNSNAYTKTGCKWKNAQALEYVNTGGGPDGSLQAIHQAMSEWSDVAGSRFRFVYKGTTTSHAVGSRDGKNIIDFANISGGYLGYCYWWYNSKRQTIDSDIRFNKRYSWSTPKRSGRYDLRTVALHELGHNLGLGHSGKRNAVMHATYHGSQNLHADDINGIKYLYPGSHTTTTTIPVFGELNGRFDTIVSGDFNGDGRDDIAGLQDDGTVSYSTDGSRLYSLSGRHTGIAAGDLNDDGSDDIIALQDDGWYGYHEIQSTTDKEIWEFIPGRLAAVVCGDFNGDGRDDAAGIQGDGTVWMTTDLGDSWTSPGGSGFDGLTPADLNADGRDDMLALQFDGWMDYFELYSTTDFSAWTTIPARFLSIVSGDFDGDGHDDIAGIQEDGEIWYSIDTGETWNVLGDREYVQAAVGDFDDDGHDDIAAIDSVGNIYITDDTSTWTQVPGQVVHIITGDFNSDGRDDIAGIQPDGTIYWRYIQQND